MAAPRFNGIQIPDFAKEFLLVIAASYPKSTYTAYQQAVRRFHAFVSDYRVDFAVITHVHTELLLQEMVAQGLSSATRSQQLILIRGYLRWLHDHRLIPVPAEDLIRRWDFPKKPFYLPRPLSPEIDQLLQLRFAQSEHRYGWGFLLMRLTGLRISELTGLSFFDCLVTHGDGHYYLKVPLGKLNSERLVPLTPDGVQLINRIREATTAISKKHELGSSQCLLTSRERSCVSVDQLGNSFHRYAAALPGDIKVVPHQLRHTFATSFLNAGMSLPSVMRLLGHRTPAMTFRYARVAPETIRREYFVALEKMKTPFVETLELSIGTADGVQLLAPERSLSDVRRWILKHTDTRNPESQNQTYLLLKRLDRIRTEIMELPPIDNDF